MSKEKWGSSQSWWCRRAVWPAGRKLGRLRRRLEVAVARRRRRREGRHAAGRRRPRQLLLEGHRLRLRLDLEGRDVAPDREVSFSDPRETTPLTGQRGATVLCRRLAAVLQFVYTRVCQGRSE